MVKIKIRGDYLLANSARPRPAAVTDALCGHAPSPAHSRHFSEPIVRRGLGGVSGKSHQDDLEVQKLPMMLVSKQFRFLFLKTKDWI